MNSLLTKRSGNFQKEKQTFFYLALKKRGYLVSFIIFAPHKW